MRTALIFAPLLAFGLSATEPADLRVSPSDDITLGIEDPEGRAWEVQTSTTLDDTDWIPVGNATPLPTPTVLRIPDQGSPEPWVLSAPDDSTPTVLRRRGSENPRCSPHFTRNRLPTDPLPDLTTECAVIPDPFRMICDNAPRFYPRTDFS